MEEEEVLAIRALLDDCYPLETAGPLSPLSDELCAVEASDASPTAAVGGNASPPEAASPEDAAEPKRDAAGHARARSRALRARVKQKDPNRARREQRLELVGLRRQITALESHLDKIRTDTSCLGGSLVVTGEVERARPTLRIADMPYPSQDAIVLFEARARDERAKRLRAETENSRLRLHVSNYVKTANQLRRILLPRRPRRARFEAAALDQGSADGFESAWSPFYDENAASGDMAKVVLDSIASEPTDNGPISRTKAPAISRSQVFEMLKHSVTRARRGMDALFAANGLTATEKEFRSAKVEQTDEQRATMELAANKILRYDLESVRQVAWRHFVVAHSRMPDRTSFQFRDNEQYVKLDGMEDTRAGSYSTEIGNGFVSGKFDEWRVVRQFVEPDRVIFVCCILSEVSEFASKPVSGIRILKEIYIVLCRPSWCRDEGSDSLNPTAGPTLMQTLYRFQPVRYKATPGLDKTLTAVTDFMFGFTGGRISLNYQMIEEELRATVGS